MTADSVSMFLVSVGTLVTGVILLAIARALPMGSRLGTACILLGFWCVLLGLVGLGPGMLGVRAYSPW
jgi:hypothetical protein